jgi:formylglycine-generating enzyme required for sulfatase activity
MVRTLSSKKILSANCKDSEEIEPFLSGDLIDSSISNPGHSYIGIPVNYSMDYTICNSTNKSTNNLTNNSTNNLTNNSTNNLTNNSTKNLSRSLTIKSIGMEFILVSAGEFDMGSPIREKRRKLWESPVHRVAIGKPFYLARYPVTQKQWQKVMGNNPSYFKGEKHPVENVSWNEIQVFFRKLNALENTDNNQIYRLPTEAEWEYAARAGTTTAYFFGDDESELRDYAWFLENSGLETHPVGLKRPNPWGLYDIYGNVGEWVQDEYHISYKGAPADGRAWENSFPSVSTPVRIRRGGGWNGNAGCCRSAERLFAAQDKRLNSLGFRVVREV